MSIGLSAHNLAVEFDAPDGGKMSALGPVTFHIPAGQFVTLLGPSGCGKSTLIRVLAGLLEPSRGEAHLNGTALREPSNRVGLMFQQANLMPWRTVIDNIALPLELIGMPRVDRYQAVNRLIPMLGLEDFERAYPDELSGGMAQRAALGRVLVQNPDVLLLDEPFGALDAMTREKISLDLLHIWERQGQTVLMVTHDIHEAVLLSDRVLVMSRRPGRIIADIPVDLPRPRTVDVTYDAEFAKIARRVRAAIDEA